MTGSAQSGTAGWANEEARAEEDREKQGQAAHRAGPGSLIVAYALGVALERANVVARRARLPFKMVRGPMDFRDLNVAAPIVATI